MNRRFIALMLLLSMIGYTGQSGIYAYSSDTEESNEAAVSTSYVEEENVQAEESLQIVGSELDDEFIENEETAPEIQAPVTAEVEETSENQKSETIEDGQKEETLVEDPSDASEEPEHTYDFVIESNQKSFLKSAAASDPEWPNQGAIYLEKNAQPLGANTWEMELIIRGKDFEATNDIVLVLDISNTINTPDLVKIKNAAKDFGTKLLTEDNLTRIKIVTYSSIVVNFTDYYTYSNLDEYLSFISDISLATGTGSVRNLQAGINKAHMLLYPNEINDQNQKNMVILSTSDPTVSFPFVATETVVNCTLKHNTGIGLIDIEITNPFKPDYSRTTYDIDKSNGTKFIIDYNAYVDVICEHGKNTYRYGVFNLDEEGNLVLVKGGNGTNNGIGPIWEAQQSIMRGTNIFSISFAPKSDGENVLKELVSSPSNFYSVADSNDIATAISNAFDSIASKVSIAAKNGEVTDPMGEYVDLLFTGSVPVITKNPAVYSAGDAHIYISQGTASYNRDNETISWGTGNINEGDDAIMKYRIKLGSDEDVVPDEVIYPNGITTFTYDDYRDHRIVKEFDVPPILAGGETIYVYYYRVNEQGHPVNSLGTVVPLENAQRLKTESYTAIYGPYLFTAVDEFEKYSYYGYILNGGPQVIKTKIVSITTTESGGSPKLWFGYYLSKTDLKINKNGSEDKDEKQSFLFKITGNGIELTVTVNGNGSVMIKDLPIGEYAVTEVTDWSFRYSPDESTKTVTTMTSETKEVTFTNTRTLSKWLSGDSWLKNIFTQWTD